MKEAFLHFLWRTRRFDATALTTTQQQPLHIIRTGQHNTHAGPDFFNARINIDGTEWAGNIEMHLRSSEWAAHGHQNDAAYDNVVLHVVWDDDQPVRRPDGSLVPCLSLRGRVQAGLLNNYQRLLHEQDWIPCAKAIGEVPDLVRHNWFDRLAAERLELKTGALLHALETTENHWEEAFYRILARSFGLKVNSEPFEMLARSLPWAVVTKHRHNLFQLEALLFGQAGMLEGVFQEEHPRQLAKEYRFLRHKYQLVPIPASNWKFLRLRPASFPSIRLAQFARLLHQTEHLFSQLLETDTLQELVPVFQVELDGYWHTHYRFEQTSEPRPKRIGPDFMQVLAINTLVPALFLYGKLRHRADCQEKALRWLDELEPEENTIIEGWKTLGIRPRNGADSQALLHLKQHYCDQRRCVECAIGSCLL
jgi:hypothetical protein